MTTPIIRTQAPAIQTLSHWTLQQPQHTTLANGIPLDLLNLGEQDVVRLDIIIDGGRWQQEQKLQALFTNRMLREGTATYSASTIAQQLDFYGAWLELTSSSQHSYVTLYSLNRHFPHTLAIVSSMLREALFPDDELHTVLQNNLQQFLVNSGKVDFLAQRQLFTQLYGPEHVLGNPTVQADYLAITSDVLRQFYRRHYSSDHCRLFLSGRLTTAIIQAVESQLGSAPFGQPDPLRAPSPIHRFALPSVCGPIHSAPGKTMFTPKADSQQSSVRLGAFTLSPSHPDYYAFRVLVTLFGGYFGSRLMSNIREDKGYTYGIYAGTVLFPDSHLLTIQCEADHRYVRPLIREIYSEIDRLRHTPVSPDELTLVRNYMVGDLCRDNESAFSIADSWTFLRTSGLPDDYFERLLHAITTVRPADLQRLAQDHLDPHQLKESIVGIQVDDAPSTAV